MNVKNANSERLERILTRLGASSPRGEMTPAMLEIYAERLQGINLDLIEAAVLQLIDTGTWLPAISEIKRTVRDLMGGDGLPSPTEAWGLVRDKKHRDHPACDLIEQAFEDVTSRWQIDNATAYELTQHRHAFTQRYGELLAHERLEQETAEDVRRLVDRAKAKTGALPPPEPPRLEPPPKLEPLPPPIPDKPVIPGEYVREMQAWRDKVRAIQGSAARGVRVGETVYVPLSDAERERRRAEIIAKLKGSAATEGKAADA